MPMHGRPAISRLQEAARIAFGLQTRPTAKEMVPLAEPWRPLRAVAARVLWTYYRTVKGREGAPVVPKDPPKKSRSADKKRCQWPRKATVQSLMGRTRRTAACAALRPGAAARRVPARLRRRRQRSDRDRPRLAAILPHAAFVSPHAPEPCGQAPVGRQWFPLTFRDPNERWIGVNKAAPVLERFLDAELAPPQVAAVGAGAGRFQPGHHDGAACRAAPRRRAGRDRRLFRPPRRAARRRSRSLRRRDQVAAAGAAGSRRSATNSFRRRRYSRQHRGLPRSRCRSNGICRPASVTASMPRGCATAASFWPGGFGVSR